MELRRSTLFVFLFIVAKIGTTGFAQIDLIFSENISTLFVQFPSLSSASTAG